MREFRMQSLWLALIALGAVFACGSSDDPSEPGSLGGAGSAGDSRGGSAGEGARGGAAGTTSASGGAGAANGVGGADEPGGASGASGTEPPAGGSDAGGEGGGGPLASCSERSDGALIDFQIVGETLRVWIEDDAFIDEAQRLLDQGEQRIPVFGTLVDGLDCDAQWTWHPQAADVGFADVTIELCDGLPSHVENDKAYWIETVMSYCPWSAEVTAVDDRR
jgi:hypothetical protein